MRWLRLLSAIVSAKYRSKLGIDEVSRIQFRVWLTDVDVSIMNHAPLMTIMEMGRLDFMVRTGFMALATKNAWYFPTRNIEVEFLKPLKLFQKAEVTTRVVHSDDNWIYVENKVVKDGQCFAIAVTQNAVKRGRDRVPNDELATELGANQLPESDPVFVEYLKQRQSKLSVLV